MSTYIRKKSIKDKPKKEIELNVKSIEILFEKLKENKINREHFHIFFERKNDINLSDYEVDYILHKFRTTGFDYSEFEQVIKDFCEKHSEKRKSAYNTQDYRISADNVSWRTPDIL